MHVRISYICKICKVNRLEAVEIIMIQTLRQRPRQVTKVHGLARVRKMNEGFGIKMTMNAQIELDE